VTVLLDTVAEQRDRYGRLLAHIRLPDGSILGERLIAEGYGYADSRFEHSSYDKYAQSQEQAIEKKMGLWAGINRSQLPDWLRRRRPDLLRVSEK